VGHFFLIMKSSMENLLNRAKRQKLASFVTKLDPIYIKVKAIILLNNNSATYCY
jgi:hypothetical protein